MYFFFLDSPMKTLINPNVMTSVGHPVIFPILRKLEIDISLTCQFILHAKIQSSSPDIHQCESQVGVILHI